MRAVDLINYLKLGFFSKEGFCDYFYLNQSDAADVLMYLEQEGFIFQPKEDEYSLAKDSFSNESIKRLEDFFIKYIPRYDCADVNDYNKRGDVIGINVQKVCNFINTKYVLKTIVGLKLSETFVYDEIYKKVGEGFLKAEIEKLVGSKCNNHLVAEVLGKIQRITTADKEEFNRTPEHLEPLLNGVYNRLTGELEKYNPDLFFKYKLNVTFIKSEDCPKFKKFLEATCYEEDIPVIQEFFGFCFIRKYFLKKGMILVGGKNTGKTTLINILASMLGEKNCSGISLQRITANDKFGLSSLYEKYLNFYDDLSFKDLNDAGGFKVATGNGWITAEYKFGDSFQFRNFAKLLFAANKIPKLKDVDDSACYSRWLPVQFDNEVPEDEIDPFLFEKLTEPNEKAGIFNWAMEGLSRLLKNNRFSFTKTPEEVKSIMCRSGNPLFAFVADVLQEQEGAKISKEAMHEIYKIYARENKLTPLSKEQLGRQLNKIAPFIISNTSGEGGKRIWENVSIVSFWMSKEEIIKILDTLDTSKKSIRESVKSDLYTYDIISKKVSNSSKEELKDDK
jgi:P4 family phage/plasmid primase-like protien